MALLDVSALQAVLKQKYTQRRFNLLCYKKNPFYALIPKVTDFTGKNKVIALRNGVPQGRGVSIAAAQANKTASVYTAFTVTRVADFATASITGEAVKAAKGDEGTLIEGLTKEIDGTIHVCMRSLAIAMYRDGGGARGQIASGSTTATITLGTLTDVTNFEIGMILQTASDSGGGATPAGVRAGTVTVTGMDRDLGTVTVTPNWNVGIPAIGTTDFIFQGNAAGTDYSKMVKGLTAWCPATAPGASDSFFGVNRSTDVTRLAGLRFNGQGGPIEETFIEAAGRAVREGASPDHVMMNPLDWTNLVKALGAKVLYDRAVSVDEPEIGFKSIELQGPEGAIKVLADVNCPKGLAYMLQLDTWHLESLGEAPMILDFDGNTILRSSNSDDYEVRVGYYANMTCEAPGWNVNITL